MNDRPHPIWSTGFWRAYLITMRPYLLFVSGTAGLVGMAFIKSPATARIALGFIPLFLAYGFGQALTDCFQVDTDAISSPYRPLVKGTVSRMQVMGVSLAGFAAGAVVLAALNPKTLAPAILCVLGLLGYTPLKRTWWGGPICNSCIVALLPLMGRLVDRQYPLKAILDLRDPASLSLLLAVAAIFFAYANFVVMGHFKDISADRRTGYHTVPVALGVRTAAVVSDAVAAAAAACVCAAILLTGRPHVFGMVVFLSAAGLNLCAQVQIHRTRKESDAYEPISHVVRAFLLYCIAIIVTLKPGWWVLTTMLYVLFEFALRLRPEKAQV